MNPRVKTASIWTLAVLLTLAVAVYQRITGPTHPLRGSIDFADQTIDYRLPRSAETGSPLSVKIKVPPPLTAGLEFRRLNSDDTWMHLDMERKGEDLVAHIPSQPPAGKVEYRITFRQGDTADQLLDGQPVVARFKGPVPTWFLIIHVLFMFTGMLLAARSAFTAWEDLKVRRFYVRLTALMMFLGGMIMGPVVQKFAFGHFWTGFPNGTDLTDNKTLVIMIFWLLALFLYKKNRFILTGVAILTLAVYLIPHSLRGSELDHRSGRHLNTYSLVEPVSRPGSAT